MEVIGHEHETVDGEWPLRLALFDGCAEQRASEIGTENGSAACGDGSEIERASRYAGPPEVWHLGRIICGARRGDIITDMRQDCRSWRA